MADGWAGPPQIDYNWIGKLPDQFASGQEYQRQNRLRTALGTADAKKALQEGDFGTLARIIAPLDPAAAEGLLKTGFGGGGDFGIVPYYTTDAKGNIHGYQLSKKGGPGTEISTGQNEAPIPGDVQTVDGGNVFYRIDPRTNRILQVVPKGGRPEPGMLPAPGATAPMPTPGLRGSQTQGVGEILGQQTAAPQQPQQQGPIDFREYDPSKPQQPPQPQTVGPGDPGYDTAAPQPQYGAMVPAPGSLAEQKVEQVPRGRKNITADIGSMAQLYAALDANQAIVHPGAGYMRNAIASAESSGIGQTVGGIFGTREQAARQTIINTIPRLIANMRAASGLSARSLDSNIELQFYQAQASNPKLDVISDLAALDAFDRALGLGGSLDKAGLPPALLKEVRNQANVLMAQAPHKLADLAKVSPEAADTVIQAMQEQQQGQ